MIREFLKTKSAKVFLLIVLLAVIAVTLIVLGQRANEVPSAPGPVNPSSSPSPATA